MVYNKNIKAVIVAAGSGNRFGGPLPKQFCNLAGRPMLMTTIDRMARVVGRENIVVALSADALDLWGTLCEEYRFETPSISLGGATRSESVARALATFCDEPSDTCVMIHDGARPLASIDLLRRLTSIPEGASGVIPVVPVTDSLRAKEADGSTRAVDRSRFVAVQTPQTFPLGTLKKVYIVDGTLSMSDDASVIEAAGYGAPAAVPGEPTNIKITNPLDMAVAETILANAQPDDNDL